MKSSKLGAPPPMPALAKHESTLPSASRVSAKAASTWASSPTSQRTATVFVPNVARASAAAAFLASFVPQMATSAPAWARASAMPRPMPLLPPVTRAACPLRSKGA